MVSSTAAGLNPSSGALSRLRDRVPALGNPLRPLLLAAGRSTLLRRVVTALPVTRSVVRRYVPGEGQDAVVDATRDILASGRAISIDHLGEDTSDPAQAEATVQAYLALLAAFGRLDVPAGLPVPALEVSLKLSALGQFLPQDGHAVALANARRICSAAEAVGAWVNVDAEDHTTTDSTLSIVRELRADHPSVATVLQAYLRRTEDDCRTLAGEGSRIRLCKGAYAEPADVAFQRSEEVDDSYRRCLEVLFTGDGYPMVASHDPAMIDAAHDLARRTGRADDSYEFQMLYGIRDDEQRRLAADGHTVRVYTPYGDEWYGYFMRRLAERPANLLFFLRSLVPSRSH
ncbi:proline dehydrogenase family protein [Microlunatus flavus]|uniref:proline dehydrogenase n=1 Tax=Microlunatus flavus TaxID=1036181 RepID=A0A1H9LNB3_9ACTN|nr:proline dehydrogenase family protein [Microlunatus flavus]SER12981.1 proline dehydrogenase [Microlunatus flavus]